MRRRPLSVRTLLVATTAALAAGGVGIATGAIPGAGGQVDGCYSRIGGVLRVIDKAKGETCLSKLETPISWSQAGPSGPKGDTGPKGDKGEPGAPGAGAGTPTTLRLPKIGRFDHNWTPLLDITGVGRFDADCRSGFTDPTVPGAPVPVMRYTNTTTADRTLYRTDEAFPSPQRGTRVSSGASQLLDGAEEFYFGHILVVPEAGSAGASAELTIGGIPSSDTLTCEFWGNATTH